jgi:LCP family protein required for cell wall assembly
MSGANQAEQADSPEMAGTQDPSGAPPGGPAKPAKRKHRKHRGRRIALISLGAVLTLAVVVAVGGYATANHFASNIKRIPNAFTRLDAVNRPVLPAATAKSITILLTGSGPFQATSAGQGVAGASTKSAAASGLIALVHFNANRKAASVVSIPSNTEVNIPGHGRSQLVNALVYGGPSLLIATIQKLTDVPIDHYTVVNFAGLTSALRPLGGVDVDLPKATVSDGVAFKAGVNHLTSATALAYVRQSSLTQEQRSLRQQALLRAIVAKLVTEDLIKNPLKDLSLLGAFTSSLSVDSDFSNGELYSLSGSLHLLRAGSSTFVTAPVTGSAPYGTPVQLDTPVARQLWQAIRNDSVASFATQHPGSRTPNAPN